MLGKGAAYDEKQVDAELSGFAAHGAVSCEGIAAEFGHLAEDGDRPPPFGTL